MKYSDAHGHFHTLGGDWELPEECVRAVCCGTHPGDWGEVMALAAQEKRVVPALGLHPWSIGEAPGSWLEDLRRRIAGTGVGVGEIGLDRTRRSPSLDIQEPVLRSQLALAKEFALPVTLHCVGAWGRLFDVLDEVLPQAAPVLFHGFSASREMVSKYLEREGGVFSFGSGMDPALLRAIPSERRVFESDAAGGNLHRPRSAWEAVSEAAAHLGQPVPTVAENATLALKRFLEAPPIS